MADAKSEIAAGERFAFGENWRQFLELLDEDRIKAAEQSLRDKLGDLTGLRFLDIGSGSGLFSLAARLVGASVVSFDFDPDSVACTAELRRRYFPDDSEWQVEQGSALDREFMRSLGTFDVVYSWGVLHHTGQMWEALKLAGLAVKPGSGRLLIALYNDQGPVSHIWRGVKRTYVRSGPRGRSVVLGVVGGFLNARAELFDKIRQRPATLRRGMDRQRDILDWVGGWPFEVAKPGKVIRFFEQRAYSVERIWLVGRRMGNNEFLFRKSPLPPAATPTRPGMLRRAWEKSHS